MTIPDKSFWSERYQNHSTGWDAGKITTPLKSYFDQLGNKDLRILIPGAGNSHEAEYLWSQGFRNVFVLDIVAAPLQNLLQRVPGFPAAQAMEGDFFACNERFDIIVEQTFFCAISPSLRQQYAKKCFDLLNEGGKLMGLLFNDPLIKGGPPFGGSKEEYQTYFEAYFDTIYFDTCYNSIPPRAGRELFILLRKKNFNTTTNLNT